VSEIENELSSNATYSMNSRTFRSIIIADPDVAVLPYLVYVTQEPTVVCTNRNRFLLTTPQALPARAQTLRINLSVMAFCFSALVHHLPQLRVADNKLIASTLLP
jgi:hypothetical protein